MLFNHRKSIGQVFNGWRGSKIKEKEVRYAIQEDLQDEALANQIFELVKNQSEY